ncbi:MAG: DUF6974 family protein [Candidatus Puniceispirillaceae bacterium]
MTDAHPALINYTIETFANERDMEFHLHQADKRFERFMPRFREAGMKRITGTKIWNKEGKAMVGWIFEYENAEAFKACQSIWKQIEQAIDEEDGTPVIRQAFRGVVFQQLVP